MVLLAAALLLGGCHHPFAGIDRPPLRLPTAAAVRPAPVVGITQLNVPAMDLALLDSPEFYPPGAKHLTPTDLPMPATVEYSHAAFPRAGTYRSPDAQWWFEETGYEQWDGIHLTLVAVQRKTNASHTLFHTRSAHDVLWAPDSRRAALTVYSGSNWSMVYVIDVPKQQLSDPIYPARAIGAYLPENEVDAPQFVTAYRWTQDGRLVLRGIGRFTANPDTVFGYELLATPRDNGASDLIFLRGYTKDMPATHNDARVTLTAKQHP